jgi:riboflavin synthase
MFTGIVQATGRIASRTETGADLRLVVDAGALSERVEAARLAVGESIAVNGVCLTVISFSGQQFAADVSVETLQRTTLAELQPAAAVNLEAALRVGDPLGGHLMSGHVDGIAVVQGVNAEGRSLRVRIEVPAAFARYIASKGSVSLDGISLTVNAVQDSVFDVNLIPHTLEMTNLKGIAAGRRLNLEVDPLARYAERVLVHLRT